MRRLALSLAPAALALAFAGPACGAKDEPPAPQPAAPAGPAPPPARAPGRTPAPPPIAAAAGKLPGACDEYRATIERLAECGDGLPLATRDALRANFEREWAGWQQGSGAQPELEAACQRAADNVKLAASDACGW